MKTDKDKIDIYKQILVNSKQNLSSKQVKPIRSGPEDDFFLLIRLLFSLTSITGFIGELISTANPYNCSKSARDGVLSGLMT